MKKDNDILFAIEVKYRENTDYSLIFKKIADKTHVTVVWRNKEDIEDFIDKINHIYIDVRIKELTDEDICDLKQRFLSMNCELIIKIMEQPFS